LESSEQVYAPEASSSSDSWRYVARWSDGISELIKDTAERVIHCAKEILAALDISEPVAEVS
jgi:hypothetical protein